MVVQLVRLNGLRDVFCDSELYTSMCSTIISATFSIFFHLKSCRPDSACIFVILRDRFRYIVRCHEIFYAFVYHYMHFLILFFLFQVLKCVGMEI